MYRNRRGTFDGGNFAAHLNFDGALPVSFKKTVDGALSVASCLIETTVIPVIHDCNRRPVLVQLDRIPFRDEAAIIGPNYSGKLTLVVNATVDTMYAEDIEDALRFTAVQAAAEVSNRFADACTEELEMKRVARERGRQLDRLLGPLAGLDGRSNGHGSHVFLRT